MIPANNLKIESLNEEWSDKDNIMLHACFQLLKDCIENEKLFTGHVDWSHSETMRCAKAEIEYLYTWWLGRVEQEKQGDLDPGGDQYEIDTDMLIRLMKVRQFLWT